MPCARCVSRDQMNIDVVAPGNIGDVEMCRSKRFQVLEIAPTHIDLELAVL